ncbi:MAG: VOC family protein [Chloroflexota bacterium]|nr:VOC family protein [Chloroflexota bacterium]
MTSDLTYFVIPVADADRAHAFYGGVLGWQFAPGTVPDGYQITNVTPPGGLSGNSSGSHVQVYFSVEDIQAAITRVRALGGEAGDVQKSAHGYSARCRDDQGTHFSLYQHRGASQTGSQ